MARLRHRDEAGSTVVEFAIIVPLVLMVMFGIIQYGYLFWAKETAAASAREAARRASVGTEWTCTRTEALARARQASTGSVAPTITLAYPAGTAIGSRLVVTISMHTLDLGIFPVPGNGVVTETATARVENRPYVALGCG